MEKTLNNLTFLSKGDDWFWDNDENGMTYFIYDRNHDLHDAAPEQKRYQLIMTPQSEIGNVLTLNIIPDCSSCVLESDDCNCMNSWANNMSDGLFPVAEVPETIIQYESMKQFIKACSSSHMTESDNNYLFEKALKAYHIDKQNLQEYLMWDSCNLEETECPKEYENSTKFMEGAGNIAANVGAGGAGALVMQLMKNLPGPWQAIGGIGTAIASGFAKYLGTAAAVKHTDEYKNMVAEGKSKEANKLVLSKAMKSAAQAVAAAGAGALASKFLPGLIDKIGKKMAVNKSAGDLEKEAAAAVESEKEFAPGDGSENKPQGPVLKQDGTTWEKVSPEDANPPPLPEEPKLPTPDKMDMTQLKNFNAAQYKDFLAKDPNNLNALLSNPAIATNPEELAQLNAAGAFDNLTYGQMGQLRTNMKNAGIDTTKFQGLLNAKVSPTLKGASEFSKLGVKQDVGMVQGAGLDKYLTNQYVTGDQRQVLKGMTDQGFGDLTGQVGQNQFYQQMGLGGNANPYTVSGQPTNGSAGVTGTYDPTKNVFNYTNTVNGTQGSLDVNGYNWHDANNKVFATRGADGNVVYTDAKGRVLDQAKGMKAMSAANKKAADQIAKQQAQAAARAAAQTQPNQ